MLDESQRRRVAIEGVAPEIDAGRYPVKRAAGEEVVVEADVFVDGPDALACRLLHRREGEEAWASTPMEPLVNDRWRGRFTVTQLGCYAYTLEAWVDPFGSWRRDLGKKVEAGMDLALDLISGAELVAAAAERASGEAAERLAAWAKELRSRKSVAKRAQLALSPELKDALDAYPDRRFTTRYDKVLEVVVDREKARFSTWYEVFPRSCAPEPGAHGTFADCQARLPEIAAMGFDVLYFPPIHPIGITKRKGPNNTPEAGPQAPGSPWAIGSQAGGHKSVHPDLGTLEDFRALLAAAQDHGLEVALDLAFQCSPDHPYVREHSEWFRHRPDGSVQFAENPPKKYEDIYPLNFETDAWRELWEELESIVAFWIEQGVRIFRVDNPHTKPFAFWEWLIRGVRSEHPEVIFLAEAFTRPKVMYRLAKQGFTQSYTYFTWRNTSWELRDYLTELTRTPVAEFFRPNFWPNTPDILTEYLQTGGPPAFMARLVLAGTLAASYGIYGPAFEACENRPREPGSEEYLDSEKYQIRRWDPERARPMRDFIARVNRIRHENVALHTNAHLVFHNLSNANLLAYSKRSADRSNVILTVVNLDPHHTQSGWIDLDPVELGIDPEETYQMHDLLGEARYLWQGTHNYIELNPHVVPAHIFRVRRRIRSEQDFEYFL